MKCFNLLLITLSASLLGIFSVYAQDDADYPTDDSVASSAAESENLDVPEERMTGGTTDSDVLPASDVLFAPNLSNPLAFGVVYSDGRKWSGSSNWNSVYNPSYSRYEITISGESYYYLNYATTVTPAGDVRYCRSSSVNGKLLVYCYDRNGNPATSRFGFATFKQP